MGLSWSILGLSWDILAYIAPTDVQLGGILAHHGPSYGHLGAILGPSWGHLGAILGLSGGAGPPKTLIFLRFFKVFAIWPSSLQLRLSYPILRHLVFLLGPLGVILGPFWTPSGPSWGSLGPSLGHPGPSWGLLGATLGPSWLILGPSWATLGPPWSRLGPWLAHLEPMWPLWGLSWSLPGAFLAHLGAILEPSWDHPGAISGGSFDIVGYCGLFRGRWTSQNPDILTVFECVCYSACSPPPKANER